MKHSPKCDEFCTVSIANVTQTTDRDGSTKETVEELSRDLILPKSMLDLIAKFEKFSASTPATAV